MWGMCSEISKNGVLIMGWSDVDDGWEQNCHQKLHHKIGDILQLWRNQLVKRTENLNLIYNTFKLLVMQTECQITPHKQIKKVLSSSSISTVISEALQCQESKKYTKITNEIKEAFLQLIINQNCSIKKAAEQLNINYSSAKTIISLYREKNRKKFKGPSRFHKRAGYRETAQDETERTGCLISTSIGGIETSTRNIQFGRNKLIKKLRVVQIVRPELP